ncbi:(E2-independent) E3 ubiquitin-conjugating enzyme FATS [Hyperolius riggenbachi]|uniref:(E2-independent) E3 ubiquitin-conjugating enzyme FATS n=1 Tax=Hyperolius riggenbachi TaxID=752182 RepID=UPI0035A358DD
MIDEDESGEDRSLNPEHCAISAPHTKPSLNNHHSVSISRTFTPLPIKLHFPSSLDKTIRGAGLHPVGEGFRQAKKKGFSSITITARRYIASLSRAPKEITSDPASSLRRSNDLLMKASVSSDEHDEPCRYLGRAESGVQAARPSGLSCSHEWLREPDTTAHGHLNDGHNKDPRLFISGVHIKKGQTFPGSIYYIDRSLFLPLGQCHAAKPRVYKSTLTFKMQPRPARPAGGCLLETEPPPAAQTLCSYLSIPMTVRDGSLTEVETQLPEPNGEIHYRQSKERQQSQKRQKDTTNHKACQDVSNYLNIEAFGSSQTHKEDPPRPVCEIYTGKDLPPPGDTHLRPERPTVTKFNYIFGKQIANLEKAKQNFRKDRIASRGHRWHKSCGKSGNSDKENMPLPGVIDKKKNRTFSRELMSLQEALKHNRPDFICNSQERVHRLELMVLRRKIQKQETPTSALPAKRINLQRKVFTVPHPLSDNLFKPKERTISEREMHQRSRRIYKSLPEVKKKKEEEEKRMLTQSNRLRAQLFKKKLLDQILQRTSD